MASKDPLNAADQRKVHISEARCSSPLLHRSKQYRLHFTIHSPVTVTGLRSPKSEYIEAIHDAVTWKDPFRDEFTVTPTSIDCRVNIDLRKRRFGRSGQIIASCDLDLSTKDKEISLNLKDGANNEFGELTICVASSLASTREAVQNASQAAERLGPGLVNDAIQTAAPLATQITAEFNVWQPLLSRLDALVKVADLLAEVHPWIKLAWGVVSAAYKILSVQSERDAKVTGLVQTMVDSCSFADEAEELKKRSERDQDVINQILRQVMECTYFIRDYCRDKSIVKRTVKYTISLVDTRIDTYKMTLENLRRNLIDHANIQCTVITHRVLDVVTEVRDMQVLSELKYAPEAHHDLDQGCLPGTRSEIIDAIVRWAVGADTPSFDPSGSGSITLGSDESSRVLWLCGVAGAGKSSILRSCAKRLSELERKGSYYGFDRNQPLANLTNLFSTIARDLADLDNARKQRLVDAVKNDTSIRTTLDCKLQFQHFIVKSFENDKALGETIIFIDAFDESGDVTARAKALAILTKRASELPASIRVIVTSRYERDIQDALQSPLPPGVDVMLVDSIPTHQTLRDIARYIRNELRNVDELREAEYQRKLDALVQRAGTSFQWAATACRFIRGDSNAGADPRDQIGTMLHADEGLYALYGTVMKEHCNPSQEKEVKRVKSILGRIICARVPLSLDALVHLAPPDSILTPDDIGIQRQIVRHLASLLSGTDSDHVPITPLHSSYRDFLCNPERNKDFYIDEAEANERMALACFRVMDQTLTFNICQIPTSFLCNVDIPGIAGLREKHIPQHLSYACQFWGLHVSATPSSNFAQEQMVLFFQKDFLPWLEVMSLTQSSPQMVLASFSTSHMAPDLIELQHDALQFISMFATAIMTSAPHIYLSGLTFAPVSSLLSQRWQGQFPGVAKLAQGQLLHWPQMMLILEGHHGAVKSIAFSPNGKQIASASEDETIRLWNAETGASIGQPMEGHHGTIWSIAFSPDGKHIASGSDKTMQLWDVETCASIGHPMEGHTNAVWSVAFSPDGEHIASGSGDTTIQLWDVETGVRIGQPMEGHKDAVVSIAFSPDGKYIASGSRDKTIQLWNMETGGSISQSMEGHNDVIRAIAFSPDGKQIASGSWDMTIQLWNVETGVRIGQPMEGHHGRIYSIAFSPDGQWIASGSEEKTIQLWSVETRVSIGQPMQEHDNSVLSVAFSPDGKQMASGSADRTIQLWNVETGVGISQPVEGHHHTILSIAFSPDGKQIASGSLESTIQLWDVETAASIGQPMEGHNGLILSITFTPDGKHIASGSSDKTIQLWNVETGTSIGQPMEGHTDVIWTIALSPDGKQIASGSEDQTIQLWNVETGVRIGQPMKGHDGSINSIAFSPDGKQIASGSSDRTIQLWNVETGVRIGQPMKGHDDAIYSIAFSPDGKQIASGSSDKTIQLWNVETGVSIGQPMEGHNDTISSIAFLPDGKQIASGSYDKTIRLWNVKMGVTIGQPMEGHHGRISSIAFSPDGKQIASGSFDKTIRIWNVEMGAQLERGPDDVSSHTSKHILQYPTHLFPFPPGCFRLDGGWILGPNDELILWVPAAYRASLEHPNHSILGDATQIDFQPLKCGKEWVQCQELVGEGDTQEC